MIERTYIVPLRKGFKATEIHRKTKRAVSTLKSFLAKHMKVPLDNVRIGSKLNIYLWKHGIKNPPHKVKVDVIKDDNNIVKAELSGNKYIHKTKDELKDSKDAKPSKEEKKPADKKESKKIAQKSSVQA